jgi:hypothetical protein
MFIVGWMSFFTVEPFSLEMVADFEVAWAEPKNPKGYSMSGSLDKEGLRIQPP